MKEVYRDETERYKVIVEQCLYIADLNPTNIFIIRTLLDPVGIYKLNIYEGDTLELNHNDLWKIEEFDAVIGNPPYSTDPSLPNSKPLYHLFVEQFINKCKYLLYVIPSRWFVGGKGLDKFRDMMLKRKDIRLICHEDDSKKWFGNSVEIKGGCCYLLTDKSFSGKCKFNNVEYDLSLYDCIIKPKFHSLLNKICSLENIQKLYKGRFFGIETNDKRLKENGNIMCYVSTIKSKNRKMCIENYEFNENNTFWKVITPEAAHKGYSGFGELIIGKPNEIHTGSYISFKVNNEGEAKSLLSYLSSNFANKILSIRKITQHIQKDTCKWIPLVPLDREWTDDKICEFLSIDKKLIEEL